jgi:hypothetical protein
VQVQLMVRDDFSWADEIPTALRARALAAPAEAPALTTPVHVGLSTRAIA